MDGIKMELKAYLDYLVTFIQEAVTAAHCDGVIVGISGGIDSAVVAALAKKAFPQNHLCVWMPCESSDLDEQAKDELIAALAIDYTTVNVKPMFEACKAELNRSQQQSDLALANTKARLRMTTLYAMAQTKKYLVLGTDNLAEWYIGYFTKFGDGGCDLLPIVHLTKGQVREAAKILGVPELIITRPPTASLWEGQTDEKEIGFSYDEIDEYLTTGNGSADLKTRIEGLHRVSEHKRHGAVQPKPIGE
jgi:NAD+ synthase